MNPIIERDERAIIAANIDLPATDLADILMKETGKVISTTTINKCIANLKKLEESETALVSVEINKSISNFVQEKTLSYLNMLDNNVQQINAIIKDGLTGDISPTEYIKFSKQLGDSISAIMKMAPHSNNNNGEMVSKQIPVTISLDELFKSYTDSLEKVNAKELKNTDYKLIEE